MRQPPALLYGPRLAQQYGRSDGCQRSRSVRHDGALHAPFLTNTRRPPPAASLPSASSGFTFSLSFRATALGQVHLRGVGIEMHWSVAHWKQAHSALFLPPLWQRAQVFLGHFSAEEWIRSHWECAPLAKEKAGKYQVKGHFNCTWI